MVIAGIHSVNAALSSQAGSALELCVSSLKDPALREVIALAKAAGVKIRHAQRRELDRMTRGARHQGAALRVKPPPEPELGRFLSGLGEGEKKDTVLVALDQIQDPHNLGAIARSAACLGAAGLIITERNAAPVSQTVHQVSAGAISRIPLFKVVNLAQALAKLKEAGFWVYGTDSTGEPAWTATLAFPLVIVIGSEAEGMRTLIRSSCDGLIGIPQAAKGVESLNASCAASVFLYEIARRVAEGPKE